MNFGKTAVKGYNEPTHEINVKKLVNFESKTIHYIHIFQTKKVSYVHYLYILAFHLPLMPNKNYLDKSTPLDRLSQAAFNQFTFISAAIEPGNPPE